MRDIKLEKLILYNLNQITELFPQYTFSQHLWHILRSKGEKEAYFWDNSTLLNKVETYLDELQTELSNEYLEKNDSNNNRSGKL
jgi:hypothetical protein